MNRMTKSMIIAAAINIPIGLGMFIYAQVAKYQTRVLFAQVQNHDKRYVYETYFGSLNATFYVDDSKDTAALITYYQREAKHDTVDNYIKFPIKMEMTLYEPIYVYKYFGKGSNIIELVDFNKKCWGYFKAYYYIPTTHVNPPVDSLIKKEEAFILKYNSDKNVQIKNRITGTSSPYGWYCDE